MKPFHSLAPALAFFLPAITLFASAQAKSVRTNQERSQYIKKILASNNIGDASKFEQILSTALSMEGPLPTGPDVLFSKTPAWSKYCIIFTDSYRVWAPLQDEYKQADLAFLEKWVQSEGPKKLTEFMTKLGYFNTKGIPHNKPINSSHLKLITNYALNLYKEP